MNHAPSPEEVNYDAMSDLTVKNIWSGDEIFEDYRKIPNHEKVFKWLK